MIDMSKRREVDPQVISSLLQRIPVNSKLDFQPLLAKKERFAAQFVGMDGQQIIIIKMLSDSMNQFRKMTPGAGLVIRLLLEGEIGICLAFRSFVMHRATFPGNYLFCQCPTVVQTYPLRKHQRIVVQIPAILKLVLPHGDDESKSVPGQIVDLSTHGCAFRLQNSAWGGQDRFDNKEKQLLGAVVELQLLGAQRRYGSGVIRNVRDMGHSKQLGISIGDALDMMSVLVNSTQGKMPEVARP